MLSLVAADSRDESEYTSSHYYGRSSDHLALEHVPDPALQSRTRTPVPRSRTALLVWRSALGAAVPDKRDAGNVYDPWVERRVAEDIELPAVTQLEAGVYQPVHDDFPDLQPA